MPKIVYLRGREAVEALSTFVHELEKQRGKELTDKQVDALIRIAHELSTCIEAQIQTNTVFQREYLNPGYYFRGMISPLAKFI